MRRCILENPVTHQKIELVEAKRADFDDTRKVQSWFRMHYGLTLGTSLYAALGAPEVPVGRGSFSLVLQCPRHADRVIKVSLDGMDGNMAAAVQHVQAQGRLRGLVKVQSVWRLRHYQDFMRPEEVGNLDNRVPFPLPKDLWIIFTEKVLPLTKARELDLKDSASDAYFIIKKIFATEMYRTQQKVIATMGRLGEAGRDWSQVPASTRTTMFGAMAAYRDRMRSVANEGARGHEDLVYALLRAADTLDELIALKMPIVDLHPGNWGYRGDELVILDFGLSSVPAKAPRSIVETDLERRPAARKRAAHPGQMVLFNPAAKDKRNPNYSRRPPPGWHPATEYDPRFVEDALFYRGIPAEFAAEAQTRGVPGAPLSLGSFRGVRELARRLFRVKRGMFVSIFKTHAREYAQAIQRRTGRPTAVVTIRYSGWAIPDENALGPGGRVINYLLPMERLPAWYVLKVERVRG